MQSRIHITLAHVNPRVPAGDPITLITQATRVYNHIKYVIILKHKFR